MEVYHNGAITSFSKQALILVTSKYFISVPHTIIHSLNCATSGWENPSVKKESCLLIYILVSTISWINISANDSLQETENNNPENEEEYKTHNSNNRSFNCYNCLTHNFLHLYNFEKLQHTNDNEEPVNNGLCNSQFKRCVIWINNNSKSVIIFSCNSHVLVIKRQDWNFWITYSSREVVIVNNVVNPLLPVLHFF